MLGTVVDLGLVVGLKVTLVGTELLQLDNGEWV